jgi:Zn-finger nucleic acid-binding protein
MVGNTRLKECPKGDGLWVDGVTLQQICQDREKQASVLGMGAGPVVPPAHGLEEVHYRPCPACGNLMNRVNFAGCSHVIVDVCMAHGTWCDRDELRQIVEFIRSGGLDKARSKQLAELQQRRRELNTARAVGGWSDFAPQPDKTSRGGFPGEIAADFLMALFGR